MKKYKVNFEFYHVIESKSKDKVDIANEALQEVVEYMKGNNAFPDNNSIEVEELKEAS